MPFCHSYCAVVWPVLARLLLDLLYTFPLLNSYPNITIELVFILFWASLTISIASWLPWPILSFWAFSAHFLSFGSLSLFPFLGHPRPILLPWAFAKSFGLPRLKLPYPLLLGFINFPSTPYSLNSLHQAFLAHSCLLSFSYNAHVFTTSFLWTPLGPLAFFEAHLLFSRPMIHYSCHSGIMVFFPIY